MTSVYGRPKYTDVVSNAKSQLKSAGMIVGCIYIHIYTGSGCEIPLEMREKFPPWKMFYES